MVVWSTEHELCPLIDLLKPLLSFPTRLLFVVTGLYVFGSSTAIGLQWLLAWLCEECKGVKGVIDSSGML